jgi:RNase P/RNase MRP subunit p29
MIIGYPIEILDDFNRAIVRGKVIDETKNTITVLTEKGAKKIIKQNKKIFIYKSDGVIKINGSDITRRPWEYAI